MSGERDREIEDLRARLARLEGQPTPATAAPPRASKPPERTGPGCLSVVLLVLGVPVALIALALCVGSVSPDNATSSTSAAGGATGTYCNEAWARRRGELLLASRLVRGTDMSASEGMIVIVRRAPWEQLSFEQQREMAATFDCGVAGQGHHLAMIRFRAERSGSDLATFDATALLHLRDQGYPHVTQ